MTSAASRVIVIANPAAGRGRAARLLPLLRAEMASRDGADLRLTSRPGEEVEMAKRAAEEGATTILAFGGDGTWGNVARGIMASGAPTRIALLAAGTGNDLAFATGAPAHDVRAAVDAAYGENEERIDVGEADGVYFVNVLGFGFDAEVLRSTQDVSWPRGHAVYLLTAARKLFSYKAFHAQVAFLDEAASTFQGSPGESRLHLAVVVANGPRFGGGFLIAPGATVTDGVFDVVRIADAAALRRGALFARARGGNHVPAPEVSRRRTDSVTLEFKRPPLFEADGELHRASSSRITVRCRPRALRLAVGVNHRFPSDPTHEALARRDVSPTAPAPTNGPNEGASHRFSLPRSPRATLQRPPR